MKKLIIANWGPKEQGKSASVKNVFYILRDKYPTQVLIDNGDIKAIVTIKGVKVGIESQGDPKYRTEQSRLTKSINDFVAEGCEIIVCACRSSGETAGSVSRLIKDDFEVIWTQNDRTNIASLHSFLNRLYAEKTVKTIEARILEEI